MLYTCSVCGQVHEGLSALGFDAPYYYHSLSESEKTEMAELDGDFCIIRYPDQTHRFIKVVLHQKIMDHTETLEYGVWVSLSEKSFHDYLKNYNSTDHIIAYFGYLSNQLPDYENTLSIRTNVETSEGNSRPEIFPHDDQMDNAFVRDYFEGISWEEAERRIHKVLGHNIQ